MGTVGPLRSVLLFLIEAFLGHSKRRTRRKAKEASIWKLLGILIFLISISVNFLLFRSVLDKLEEIGDLKRRNQIVMSNNNELMALINQTRNLSDDFKRVNDSLRIQVDMVTSTNTHLLDILKTKDIPQEKLDSIEKLIHANMIAHVKTEKETEQVLKEEDILEKKIDIKTNTMNSN